MSIEVTFEVEPEYVLLRCQGSYTLPAAIEVFEQAYAAAFRENRAAVLIDVYEVGPPTPTTMERFEIGMFIASRKANGIRVAVVGSQPLIDPGGFAETVARNRGGLYRARIRQDDVMDFLAQKAS
ncbi:MAG: hypothetical protein ACR2OI_08285 [Acidimicrobiia bacterium]